jgi:hypothetical protein
VNLLLGMDPENYSVDQILEAIDAEMANLKPKVLLFDIGGVCVSRRYRKLVLASVALRVAFDDEIEFMHHFFT